MRSSIHRQVSKGDSIKPLWLFGSMLILLIVASLTIWFFETGTSRQATSVLTQIEGEQDNEGGLSKGERKIGTDPVADARKQMIERHLLARDIDNQRVLKAMRQVPRHEFVPAPYRDAAYQDHPLPIGHNQTISQPYIVALMTQLAKVEPGARVLDIGTGSGYQAAVLAKICKEVYSIEILETLASEARDRLQRLGYDNIVVRAGDGYQGWPDKAPFDAIIVAAAPDHVPQPLIDQLAPGGHLVIPVGKRYQELIVIEKRQDGSIHRRTVAPVAFVPMTGEAQEKRKD